MRRCGGCQSRWNTHQISQSEIGVLGSLLKYKQQCGLDVLLKSLPGLISGVRHQSTMTIERIRRQSGLVMAVGAASTSGINPYATVLTLGLLQRLQWLQLPEEWKVLGET